MRYDVIIAGAGPAGATCARVCALGGLSTLLLDGKRFPRPKPCGGALSVWGRALLDFALPSRLIELECKGIRVHYGAHVVERRRASTIAFMVDRAAFDGFLADQAVLAGALFRQDERVHGVSQDEGSVAVSAGGKTYTASYLVGADGAGSTVAAQVRPPIGRQALLAAMVGTAVIDERDRIPLDGLLDMHYGIAPLGYGWVFPHGAYSSVGIMGLAAELHDAAGRFADFCRLRGLPRIPGRGHTIPLGGMQRQVARGRILLAGDAAGFADPFHGEGMAHAIHSGRLAGQAVIAAVRGKKNAVGRYAALCEHRIRRELGIALRMAWALEQHPALFLSIFFGNGPALDRYVDIAEGTSDYRRFQRWMLARLPAYLLRYLYRRSPLE